MIAIINCSFWYVTYRDWIVLIIGSHMQRLQNNVLWPLGVKESLKSWPWMVCFADSNRWNKTLSIDSALYFDHKDQFYMLDMLICETWYWSFVQTFLALCYKTLSIDKTFNTKLNSRFMHWCTFPVYRSW